MCTYIYIILIYRYIDCPDIGLCHVSEVTCSKSRVDQSHDALLDKLILYPPVASQIGCQTQIQGEITQPLYNYIKDNRKVRMNFQPTASVMFDACYTQQVDIYI